MKSKVLTVLSVLFGLFMVNSGLNKFLHYMPMPEMSADVMAVFGAYMTVEWLMPLVALAEIVGGILFAVPKTRALGAVVVFPVMVGILAHHLYYDLPGIVVGLVLFAINVWVLVEYRDRYLPMVRAPRSEPAL